MNPLDSDRGAAETDAFVRQFAERAQHWDDHPGDLEDGPIAPWVDPDHPDDRLDAAYRSGIAKDQRGQADGWDTITVLRAHGRRLAKRIGLDGTIKDYDSAKVFDMEAIPVDGIDHLEDDLRRLLHQPDRCVVRGGIADLGRATKVRRLLHPDDHDQASLIDVPRRWLALDIDGLERPANVAAEDVAACAEIAIAALPAEFHGVRCIAQLTAGHGFKPGIRMRLWYWLDRPVHGAELKRWVAAVPVDHALFSAAQIIYTAAPLFDDGRADPLPNRLTRLPGTAQVTVPELPEPAPRPAAKPVRPEVGLSPYGEAALRNACRRIGEAKKNGLDAAINSAAYGIGRLAGAGAIPPALALRSLIAATSEIPGYNSRRDNDKVERSFANGVRNPREVRP